MNDACTCEDCQALNARYESDPGLLAHYRRRLLIRGWAGRTHPTEKAYILAHAAWAQAAVEAGRNSRIHVSNGGDGMAIDREVVVGAADVETGPIERSTIAPEEATP